GARTNDGESAPVVALVAGSLPSPPPVALLISGARNSATATALACSRTMTACSSSLGPSATCEAERGSAKIWLAGGGVRGASEEGSLPVRLHDSSGPTLAGGAPGLFGSETSTSPWSTCTLVVERAAPPTRDSPASAHTSTGPRIAP